MGRQSCVGLPAARSLYTQEQNDSASSDRTHDLTDQLTRLIEWISGLGFALPFAIFLLVQLFNRSRKESAAEERRPQQPPPEQASPPTDPLPGMPLGLPSWLGLDQPTPAPAPAANTTEPVPDSQWGHSFDRQATNSEWSRNDDWGHGYDQASAVEDDVLRWGSAFQSDAEGEPIRWKSAFDEPGQRNIYGWEPAVWGGTFPPRDSEPVIHFG